MTLPIRSCLLASTVALGLLAPAQAAAETSPLDAVRAELAADGQLYTTIDFERGWSRIGEEIDQALTGVTDKPIRVAQLLESLGLTDIRALGMSSKAVPGGYDNRLFLHLPAGRRGLFAIFPGEAAPFTGLNLAPADTDLFAEIRLDIGALFTAVTGAVDSVVSDAETLAMVREALAALDPQVLSFLQFRGTAVVAVRFVDAPTGPTDPDAPTVDYFARIDTLGTLVRSVLESSETVERLEHASLAVFKVDDGSLVALEGETVLLASSLAFLDECRTRTRGLEQVPTVKDLLARTSSTGHSLVYASPRVLEKLRDTSGLASLLDHDELGLLSATNRLAITQALASLPQATSPSAAVIVARPDGILVREISTTSNKAALPFVAASTPDFLGEFAVQAVRAVSLFTATERAKEAALKQLEPDLEKIAAASRAYFAAHDDAESVTITELRAQPGGAALPDLAGQLEGELEIARRSDELILQHREHGEIRHVVPLTAEQRAAIETNLRLLDAAAALYFIRENSTSAYGGYVFQSDAQEHPVSVVGEDYDSVSLDESSPQITITTPGGQEVSIEHDTTLVTRARRQIAEQGYAIEQNLARLDAAAQAWLETHDDSGAVDSTTLFSDGAIAAPESVAGEDYQNLYFSATTTELSVDSPTLGTVSYARPLDAETEAAVRERLTEIASLATAWFAKHPDAVLVLAAELLPADQLVLRGPDDGSGWEGDAIATTPTLSAMVIRRSTAKLALTLDGGHVVEVPLRR